MQRSARGHTKAAPTLAQNLRPLAERQPMFQVAKPGINGSWAPRREHENFPAVLYPLELTSVFNKDGFLTERADQVKGCTQCDDILVQKQAQETHVV